MIQHIKFLTSKEVAQVLNISMSALYKMTRNGSIPHYSPTGKLLYFREDELLEWMLNGKKH